jgi:pyruvate, water dikinase
VTSVLRKICGIAASPGKAEGPVFVLNKNYYDKQRPSKYILILLHATTDALPLLKNSLGVISVHGGRLCHMSILCRELGIPCVTGVKLNLDEINDGTFMQINGTLGLVLIIK